MNKTKLRFITILASLALLLALLGIGIGLLSPSAAASAADQTYAPGSIFWARDGGEVRAYAKDASGTESKAYLTFVFAEGDATEGTVEYHRDLALKWYKPVNESDLAKEGGITADRSGVEEHFSMSFGFPSVNFDSYTLTFQSAEENVSKEGQAVNELVFKKAQDGSVYVYIKDASLQNDENKDYAPAADSAECLTLTDTKTITIELTDTEVPGEFLVTINGENIAGTHSRFTNVGGYFMEYRTSGTANMPLSFKAVMPENSDATQKVFMYSLNGQSFEVTGEKSTASPDSDDTVPYNNARVKDNAPPALVLSEKIYPFSLGQRFSLSYEAIDVCDETVLVSRYYYMAKAGEGEDVYTHPDLASSTKDYKSLYTSTYFMPLEDGDQAPTTTFVSIRFTLDDGTDGYSDRYYYLSWYAEDGATKPLADAEGHTLDYIRVEREKEAPYSTVLTLNDTDTTNDQTEDYKAVTDAYQAQLKEAAKNVSAGDGAYFYLPSLRTLIGSKYADYRNLRFTISYYKPGLAEGSASASSETSLRYNNLRFEVEEEGNYKFRVFAADAAGNTMKYYIDGVLTTVSTSNIWDVENYPEFSVYIGYTGAVIEKPGMQTPGNRGTSYTISDFDIVAYGDCEKDYSLYYFDESKLPSDVKAPTYEQLVEDTEYYFTTEPYSACFGEPIKKYNSDITEDDEEWDKTDNAYHWNPGSTPGSFVPQNKGFYVVKLDLTDPFLASEHKTAYQVIEIQNPRDVTSKQIDWFRNNITSVVLFAISAVLAIVIVVLFVVKPSEKSVEDVDLEKLKGKKGKKKE